MAQETPPGPRRDLQWGVLLHSHGALTHGWDTVVSLQREARSNGIAAVVLTEHLIKQWNWGPPVLRELWSYRHRQPSIQRYGIERYFEKTMEVDRLVPEVTLIAGVEVAPYYHWTGVPWNRNLTMWDWQRNLLLLDLPEPAAYAKLPVLGLRRSLLQSWKDFLWLGVTAAFIVCFLLALKYLRFFRASLALIPIVLLVWSGPPPPGPYSPYRSDAGMSPYQAVIDSVSKWGGIAIWTQVESLDDDQYLWGRVHTDPHPQVLIQTQDYHGFGSIYPSTSTVHDVGHEWDQTLKAYLDGFRHNPPWGWGELALHYPEQLDTKTIWQNQTVLFAPDRSSGELLHALRKGRGYAVRATHADGRLQLDRFEAVAEGHRAYMGEWLRTSGTPQLRVVWSFTGSEPPEVTAQLIRNGEVVASKQGTPPMSLEWTPPAMEPGSRFYYRLALEGRNHRLLSNPIFVEHLATAGQTNSP